MTCGLLIRRPRVRSSPSPLNDSATLGLSTSETTLSSDVSQNASFQRARGNRKHNFVTTLACSAAVVLSGFVGGCNDRTPTVWHVPGSGLSLSCSQGRYVAVQSVGGVAEATCEAVDGGGR